MLIIGLLDANNKSPRISARAFAFAGARSAVAWTAGF
jgi:hypothetical protein